MSKEQAGRKSTGNLVKELDAAIALLTRVRALAVSNSTADGAGHKTAKEVAAKQTKRVLSAEAREAMAAAQRKRWAKVRRQKKQAEHTAAK